MSPSRADSIATVVWLVLVLLTIATWLAGRYGLVTPAIVPVLLGSVLVKGQLVASHFMGLRAVRAPWRWMVTIWLCLVVALIGLAYRMGVH